ncbi:MAG: polyhydroxyalkanoic acid system family protein [Sphingomonas sp.]|uniref:polyhydroxyalkanoic acid system family protein n=1 Tax=Sphingomonas sp. TaxID=28214 RepID=UPI001AD16EAB|nr:polyhydroxyalkanoic acid system family protein [Sphingomonas sp.]MBN8808233.1 polyhydroxyalkanoic acid system family protein [Sphingomonas sp.]
MTEPIVVEIPHKLGQAEARSRVDRGIGKLAGMIPGGAAVDHAWAGDVLNFTVAAMGQRIASRIDVRADRVIATVDLPPFLALFADRIRAKLTKEAPRLLE